MSSDADLKLSDTLRYYERDTQAALVRERERERGRERGGRERERERERGVRERERRGDNIDYGCVGPAVQKDEKFS